jgi:hypothetical protein
MKYLNYEGHWLGSHDLGCGLNAALAVGKPAAPAGLGHEAGLARRTSDRRALDGVRINTPSQCRRRKRVECLCEVCGSHILVMDRGMVLGEIVAQVL